MSIQLSVGAVRLPRSDLAQCLRPANDDGPPDPPPYRAMRAPASLSESVSLIAPAEVRPSLVRAA